MSQLGTAVNGFQPSWFTYQNKVNGLARTAVIKPECKSDFQAYINAKRAEYRAAGGGASSPLTQAQAQALAEQYDTAHMTDEEYMRFLDKLCAEGILKQEDLIHLGPMNKHHSNLNDITSISVTAMEEMPASGLAQAKGDVLAWAKYQAGLESFDPVNGDWYTGKAAALFQRLAEIVEQMRSAA